MQTKWLFGIGIVAAALASVYFVIKVDLGNAVLSMVALFSLTNGARAKSFRDQGYVTRVEMDAMGVNFFWSRFCSVAYI